MTSPPTLREAEAGTGSAYRVVVTLAVTVCLAVASGLACVAVRFGYESMQWVFLQHGGTLPAAAAALNPWRRALTPAMGALLAMLLLQVARRTSRASHPVDYVEAVRLREGRIPFYSTVWRTAAAACSIATGAAIGREGSMIQFAAGAASWLGQRLRLPFRVDLARQVAWGVGAAVAAAYQAPIAGAFFALEIVLDEWTWSDCVPALLAGFASWFATRSLAGGGPLFAVADINVFELRDWWVVGLALVLGCAGPLYQALLRSFKFINWWRLPLVWGGLAVGLASLAAVEVWGNGDVGLREALAMRGVAGVSGGVGIVLLLRLFATTVCVGAGTVGGVFTPTLFTGAALGALFAQAIHAPHPVLLAVVGMGAFLAAVTHAPLMASFMTVELTGSWHVLPLVVILNLLAYTVSRRLSADSLYHIAGPTPAQA